MSHPIEDHRYQRVVKLLAQLRKSRRISQQELADRIGRSQSSVSKAENGLRRLDLIEFLEYVRVPEADPRAIVESISTVPLTSLRS
ncbi:MULTISPECIES: helix-turn-helix domain-containing protein [Pandoraea]|uniref:helix-turn-helix domain-containing protein n=1 Tax=Pandoraea TaxID=93217 RepID=UPI00123EF3FB|nr:MULTISPECIES: helix-turn-helix transcriptional regulator [Pandoraea]